MEDHGQFDQISEGENEASYMDSDADNDEDQLLRASEKPSEKEDADYSSLHGHPSMQLPMHVFSLTLKPRPINPFQISLKKFSAVALSQLESNVEEVQSPGSQGICVLR